MKAPTMYSYSLLLLAAVMLFLVACQSETAVRNIKDDFCRDTRAFKPSPGEGHSIDVDVDTRRTITTSEFIDLDSSNLVYLETKTDNLIGDVSELILWQDRIFVVDNRIANAVFIFNRDGAYLSKISAIGKGFGEYSGITDVILNKRDSVLLLYDHTSGKVIFFALDGKVMQERKVQGFYKDIAQLPNGNYIGYSDYSVQYDESTYKCLHLFDKQFNKIDELLETPNGLKVVSERSLFDTDRGLVVASPFYNNFALLKGDQVGVFANLKMINENLIDYSFLESIRDMSSKEQSSKIRSSDQVNSIMDLLASESKLLFTYAHKSQRNTVIYDYKTNKTINCKGIVKDDLFLSNIMYWPVATSGEQWVFPMYTGPIVHGYAKTLATNQKKGIAREMVDSTLFRYNKLLFGITQRAKENDNPVLLFAGLKPF